MLAAVALVPGWTATLIVPEYFSVGAPPSLSDGAPNLWAIVDALPVTMDLPLAGLAMTMAIGAAAWLAACFAARPPLGDRLLPAALLVALTLPDLLPQMQPGDFLLAVLLSVAQREIGIAVLVMTGWLLACAGLPALGAAPIMVATFLIARPFFASPANDNGLPLNPGKAYPA